jgi:osmotically-inducible protein OsmY
MSSKSPILIGVLVLGLFAAVSIPRHVSSIELDISERTWERLDAAGFAVDVTARGRDVVLSGVVPDQLERQKASQLAAAVWGVRTVENRLELTDPLVAEQPRGARSLTRTSLPNRVPKRVAASSRSKTQGVRLTATVDADGIVTLVGRAPNETAKRIWLERAADLYRAENVRDRLSAAELEEEPELGAAVWQGLASIAWIEWPRMDATPERIRISGVSSDPGAGQRLRDEIGAAVPAGYKISVDIDRQRPAAPPADH